MAGVHLVVQGAGKGGAANATVGAAGAWNRTRFEIRLCNFLSIPMDIRPLTATFPRG